MAVTGFKLTGYFQVVGLDSSRVELRSLDGGVIISLPVPEYDDFSQHSPWLSLLYPRAIFRLTEDGVFSRIRQEGEWVNPLGVTSCHDIVPIFDNEASQDKPEDSGAGDLDGDSTAMSEITNSEPLYPMHVLDSGSIIGKSSISGPDLTISKKSTEVQSEDKIIKATTHIS